jgi:MipA family protein
MIYKIVLSLLLCLNILSAEELEKRPKYKVPNRSLGLVALYSTSPYQGQEDRTMIVPSIWYKTGGFFIRNTSLGFQVYEEDRFQIELLAKYHFEAYRESDSETLAGMDDRDATVEAGLKLQYKFDFSTVELSAYSDVLDNHSGQELELKIKKNWRWRFLSIDPYVGLSYFSNDYSNYYYGVRTKEATIERASYDLGQTFNWNTGISLRAGLNENVMLFTNFKVNFLDSKIDDSPIVDQDILFTAIIGVSYSF